MTGENDATCTILHVVSKQGGLAHVSGAVEILFQKVSENRLGEQRNGGATEGAAGRPPKGFAAKEGV